MRARAGLHVGEVILTENSPADALGLRGVQAGPDGAVPASGEPLLLAHGHLGLRGLLPPVEPLPPVTGLRVDRAGRLSWDDAGAAYGYDVLRGSVRALHSNRSVIDGSCFADDIVTPSATDPELPGVGEGFYYITSTDTLAPGTGTYDDPPDSVQGHSRDDDQGPGACADLR